MMKTSFKKRIKLIKCLKVVITIFFIVHSSYIAVMGTFLSLDAPFLEDNKDDLEDYTHWYKELTFGVKQRWRMFGKPSRTSYRFSIEIFENEKWKEFKYVTIRDFEPFNRHRTFKLLRNLATSSSKSKKLAYLEYTCKKYSIPDQTRIRLRKHWNVLPKREESVDYDWNNWDPTWLTRTIRTRRCTS